MTSNKQRTKRSIIAFVLALLAFTLPVLYQMVTMAIYNATSGTSGNSAWGVAVFVNATIRVGLIGWPLGVTALIIGIVSLKTKAKYKGLAISSIAIAGVSLISMPILIFIVSGIIGQPGY